MSDLPDGIIRTLNGDYVLRDDSHLSRWVEEHRRLDIAWREIERFKQYIPEGGIVIDCGACIGDHAKTYSQLVGVEGGVLAFEPHPLSFKALELNAANFFPINTKCFNMALGEGHGRVFFDREPNIGASHVHSMLDGPIPRDADEVQAAELDDLLTGYPHVTLGFELHRLDFIHLDAEGYEAAIIAGGAKLLRKFRPVMMVEVNHPCLARFGFNEEILFRLITSLGYTIQEFNGTPASIMRDVICIPA